MTWRVVVIGAGQAGLSAAAHLVRKGLVPGVDFVVLDGNDGPGGAWRDRWDSLTFDAAHGITDLPGHPLGPADPTEPASRVVARYYGRIEDELALGVVRPVVVDRVERAPGGFTVHARDGHSWEAASVISATGTWNSPYLPHYPGRDLFGGRQLHTRGYRSADEFAGQRVLVVGGGASATQFVMDLRRHGVETTWSTRGVPRWTHRFGVPDWGVRVEDSVASRTRAGLPTRSVVAETGLDVDGFYRPWLASGDLVNRGRLLRLTATGAVLDGPGPDGSGTGPQGLADEVLTPELLAGLAPLPGRAAPDTPTSWEVPVDAVLWATGFRAHVGHLRPLHVHEPGDDDVSVTAVPGLFLVGYGPSASTIGATRAGRKAAVAAVRFTAET